MALLARVRERARRVPPLVRALIVAPCILLPIVWGLTWSGPFRWLAEWEVEASGSYDTLFTGVVVLLASLMLGALLVQFVASGYPPSFGEGGKALIVERRLDVERWFRERRFRFVGALLSVGFLGVGLYFAAVGLTAGPLTPLTAASLEAGGEPRSRYVSLSGRLLLEQRITVRTTTNQSSTVKVYIPLVSPGWREGRPIAAWLETYETWLTCFRSEVFRGTYEGLVSSEALPGLVQLSARQRRLTLADGYQVLDWKTTPRGHAEMGASFLVMGLLVGALTGLVWWRKSRREGW